jgi:hypothetical protein
VSLFAAVMTFMKIISTIKAWQTPADASCMLAVQRVKLAMLAQARCTN